MKQLRTRQAKVIGALGVIGAILFGATLAFLPGGIVPIMAGCVMVYFVVLAVLGMSASSLMIDGDDILYFKKGMEQRIALAEVVSIRTVPIFCYVGNVTLRFRDGRKSRTIVADQDLTWIMSRMPRSAVTPYWQNRTGQQAVDANRP